MTSSPEPSDLKMSSCPVSLSEARTDIAIHVSHHVAIPICIDGVVRDQLPAYMAREGAQSRSVASVRRQLISSTARGINGPRESRACVMPGPFIAPL